MNKIVDRAGNEINLVAEGNEFDSNEKFLITEMNYRNHLSKEIQIKYSYSDVVLDNPYDNIDMINVENFRELILDLNRYYDFIPVTRKILTKVEIKKDGVLLLPSVEYSYSDKGHLNKRKLSTGGEIYYDYGIYTRQIKEYSFNKWQITNPDLMPAYINSFRLIQKRRGNSIWKYSIDADPFKDPITNERIENSFFTKWEVPKKVMVIKPDNTKTINYFEARESLTKETSCKAGTLLKEEYYSPLGKELLKTIEYAYTPSISLPCNFLLTTKIAKQGKTYREEYSYDEYNNITEFKQFGDYDNLNDNFTQKKAYLHSDNNAYIEKYILNRSISNEIYHEGVLINKSLVEYDGFGLETYGLGNPGNFLRGNVTKVTQRYGIMNSLGTVSSWDARKDIVTQTYYDIYGNRIKEVDSKGNETSFEYDVLKRLFPVKITNSLGHEVLTQYHNNGLVENITDINGNITSFQYDDLDRLVKTVNPDGSEKDITYSDFYPALWTKIENSIDAARKSELTYFFDQYGRFTNNKVKVEDGQYIENSVTYDEMDRKSTYTNPLDGISRYSYDGLGRIIKVTNPDGTFTGTKYIDGENAVEVFDENGHKIKHYFNAYSKLIKVDEFNNQNQLYAISNYTYDVLGNLLKVKDSNANHSITQYYYDTFGRIRATDQPDSGRTYYNYDKNSNLIWQKDAKNQETTFTYDELNRMLQIVYQDGHTITNEYDSATIDNGLGKIYRTDKNTNGQIIESIIINNYDVMGRPDTEEYQIPGYNINTVHDFTYNLAGQVTRKTFTYNTESLKDLSFTYDHAGRILNTYDNIGDRELVNYGYNDLSLVTNQNNFNGTSSEYTYHPKRYWMTDLKIKKGAEVLYRNQYQYDKVGNRSKLIDEFGTETTYTYDGLYRLTGVQGSYYKRSDGAYNTYSYDTTGNRMQYNSMFNDYEYQYATDSNRLLIERSMNGVEILSYLDYQYDANGNTTHKIHHTGLFESGKEEYLWNCENQMIGYRKFNKNIKSHLFDLTDAMDIEYNLAGMRLSKKVIDVKSGLIKEYDSTLYLYEGSEVEL
ncbi:RHS repeat protein, partial [bacterium]|nr:RHS repeat protein [bacterium]